MDRRHRRYSLRWRLPFAISVLVALVLTTFLWAAHKSVETTLLRAAGERAQAAADQVASMLDGRRTVEQLRLLGNDSILVRFLRTGTDADREAARTRLRALAGSGLRRVELWDGFGTRLLEVSVPGTANIGAAGQELPASARPVAAGLSPLHRFEDIAYSDNVAELVYDDATGQQESNAIRRGYVVIRSTFTESPPGVFSRLVGGDAAVRVANTNGDVWTDFSRVVPPAPIDLRRSGVTQYRADDGQLRIGAASPVRDAPWTVWVEFPRAAMVRPARAFLNQMIPVAVVFLLITAAVIGVVTARITRPLAELSAAAEAMEGGDYSRRVATTRRDETGRLAQAFNAMSDEVANTHHRLEERVATRTAELTEARRAADHANQAKSEFLSRMSHELRTPLNAIMGFAQVLELDKLTEEQSESARQILRGGRHLLGLINEVLDVARIESRAIAISPEVVSVQGIIEQAVDLIRPLAAQRRLSIHVETAANTYAIADPQRLNQILFNLLSNAVKYNREGGTVLVRSRRSDAHIEIVVEDTGTGIAKSKLDLLFTPFERLGAEESDVEGTGLGLALAKGLAEAMNGSLTADSVVDRGSAFVLRIPASDVNETRSGEPEAVVAPPSPHGSGTGRILYVEDNVSNVKLMQRLVRRRAGVELLHAHDGRTGVALATGLLPDLVFLDLHLPDGPGEEVLRQLRENVETRGIPIVVLSADATPAQKRRLLAAGATAYLTKPFDIGEVLKVIDGTLGLRVTRG